MHERAKEGVGKSVGTHEPHQVKPGKISAFFSVLFFSVAQVLIRFFSFCAADTIADSGATALKCTMHVVVLICAENSQQHHVSRVLCQNVVNLIIIEPIFSH